MILDEILVHDFGLYSERQKICLTPPAPDKPIILFGGLNGHGKTTLLDALQLCLYGPFAKISNRNDISYPDYLARCIHQGSVTRESAIEIAFRHTIDGKEDRYRLHRSWRMKKSGCKEHFEVYRNRRNDTTLAENWINHVEDLLPANISSLFLFDGEQVESYASPDNSVQLIGTAIRNLLGLDIVDQLEKDLITYTRRKRAEDKSDPKNREIEQSEVQLKELRQRSCDLKQARAALRTNHIEPAQKTLVDIEAEYRNLGGELYDLRMEIEQELSDAEQELKACSERLCGLAAGDLPLLLVRDLMKSVERQDQNEEESRRSRQVRDLLEVRDRDFLNQFVHGMDDDTVKSICAYLEADRERHRRIGERETMLDTSVQVRGDLHMLLSRRFDELIQDAKAGLKANEAAVERVENARIRQAGIPSDDIISEIIGKRQELIHKIASLEEKFDAMGDELERLDRQIERSEQILLRMIQADIQIKEGYQDRTRILEYASRVRTTLDSFRETVIARHVERIGQLVLESYQHLLHKTSLVTRLDIDPETFALTLCGRGAQVLSVERLSAGERQLLATALLWGLAKASGRVLPTAIDTPLGRLDAGHRKSLVERYFPFASHQVLLFSTDEEIMGQYLDALQPFIGRNYHLCYNDSTSSTKVLDGYFPQTA